MMLIFYNILIENMKEVGLEIFNVYGSKRMSENKNIISLLAHEFLFKFFPC